MTPEPKWKHVPDEILEAATTVSLTREAYDQVWNHINICSVCRDRYWEKIKMAQELRKHVAMQVAGSMMQMLASAPGQLQDSFLADLPPEIKKAVAMREADMENEASALLSQAEKVSEFEALTTSNIVFEDSDLLEHLTECPQCRSLLIKACEKRKASLPHLSKIVDRLIAFVKKITESAAEAADGNQAESPGDGGHSFAN